MKHHLLRGLVALILISIVLTGCSDPISELVTAATPHATIALATPNAATPGANSVARPDQPTAVPGQPTSMPAPQVDTSGLMRDKVTQADQTDAQLVMSTIIPVSNLRELAIRFEGLSPNTPLKNCTTTPNYNEGDQEIFSVLNGSNLKVFTVTATLIDKTDHAYMWLDNNWLTQVNLDALKKDAQTFSDKTYARNHALFGLEATPSIDCDTRIHILNTSNTGAGGYFSNIDKLTKQVRSDSNEKDLLYIDIEGSGGPGMIGSSSYDGTIAHEFQHLILDDHVPNEDTWVSEGMSDLAMFLNGDDPRHDLIAAQVPDIQLNSWPYSGGAAGAEYYGTAFSFMLYFWDHLGDAGVQALASGPPNGLAGIQRVLDKLQPGKSADDFVADWLIARFLDDPQIADGRYGYRQTHRAKVTPRQVIDQYPFQEHASVHQYAGDYTEFHGNRDITIDFAGSTKARLIDAQPHSGAYFMWSNRGDSTDLRMQREFDLTNVRNATLKYWLWYDLEKDWDYGYLTISADGGKTWQTIQTPSATNTNPTNANYGWGYTGTSGGGDQSQWVQETADLSPYAGKKIIVRFEVINDLAVNLQGMAVDDVEIPEINYKEDFEQGDGGWQTSGWIRTDNYVPQKYIVQLVSFGKDGQTTISRLPVNDDNTAQWDIPLSQLDRAVVVVSPMAPKTTEVARYNWSATQK